MARSSTQGVSTSGMNLSSRAYAAICLKHFLERTLPMFKKSEPNAIWTYVEQQLDSESGLRCAAIALGHEHRLAELPDHEVASEGASLYIEAVAALRQAIVAADGQATHERLFTIAFNCLLLVILQCYRKSFDDLNIHLQHGLTIASQAVAQTSAGHVGNMHSCFRLLKQYSIAMALFNPLMPQHAVMSGTASFTINQALRDPDSLKTTSITSQSSLDDQTLQDEEQNLLLDLIRTSVTLRKSQMSDDTGQVKLLKPPVAFTSDESLATTISTFRERHELLLHTIGTRKAHAKTEGRRAYFEMAEVRCVLMGVYIRRRWSGYSCAMDVEADVFRQCIDKIELLLHRVSETGAAGQGTSSSLGMGFGFVATLFYAIVMCHQPETRHKALALLKRCPQQDGPWNAILVERICRSIASHEETLARADGNGFVLTGYIPEHCRVAHYYYYATSDTVDTSPLEHLRIFRKSTHGDDFIGETILL